MFFTKISPKNIYLVLSIFGFIMGIYFIIPISIDHSGFDIIRFFREISLNNSSKLLSVDLGITATVFLAFMLIESFRLKIKYWWLALAGCFLVGLCFGFPLFLYLRERSVDS